MTLSDLHKELLRLAETDWQWANKFEQLPSGQSYAWKAQGYEHAAELVKGVIDEQVDTVERLTHGIREAAESLYRIEINQQGLGRTEDNGRLLRDTHAALISLYTTGNDPRRRWHSYIARLEKKLNEAGLWSSFQAEMQSETNLRLSLNHSPECVLCDPSVTPVIYEHNEGDS